MSTSISPAMQPILLFGPSTADVSWLNSEADYLTTIANAVAYAPGVIADAKAAEAAFLAANPAQTNPSLTAPSWVLQQIASAASSDRLKSDAARLKTLSSQVTSLLTQSAFQMQQIAGLQQQLAALQGPGTSVKGGTPTTTTTTTTTTPVSGVSTGAVIAGIAAIAALGAGAWWYMEDQKKKPGLSLKRRL